MYFFCPVFDLPNNGLIFPFKKHILISVSSSSSRMPVSSKNKQLRRRSIYIKAYFMPFGFKREKSSCAKSFSSNFSRKNVNMCTGSFPKVWKPYWPLWCKIWGGRLWDSSCTFDLMTSWVSHSLWPLSFGKPWPFLFPLIFFTTYNKRLSPLESKAEVT